MAADDAIKTIAVNAIPERARRLFILKVDGIKIPV
jgi:hypothetical protein